MHESQIRLEPAENAWNCVLERGGTVMEHIGTFHIDLALL